MEEAQLLKATLKRAIETHVAGRLDEAAELYAFVLDKAPDQVDANHNLGVVLAQQGRPAEALCHLQRAYGATPRRESVLRTYARVLIANGKWLEATAVLTRAEADGVKSVTLSRLLATARDRQLPASSDRSEVETRHDPEATKVVGAVDNRQRLVAEPPPHEVNRIAWLLDRNLIDDADAAARVLAANWLGHGLVWKLLGRIDLERGRPDRALSLFLHAVALAVDDGAAHLLIARAQGCLGQPRRAAASLARAADLRPHHADSWKELGHVLRELGYLDRSARAFHRAIALNPRLADCLHALGNIAEIMGQGRRAEDWLAAALDLTEADRRESEQSINLMEEHLLRAGKARLGWSLAHRFAVHRERGCDIQAFMGTLRGGRQAWVRFTDPQDLARGVLGLNLLAPLAAYPLGVACPARLHGLAARSFPNWTMAVVGDTIADDSPALSSRSIPNLAMELEPLRARAPTLRADPGQVTALSTALRGRFPDKILVGLSWRSSLRANPHLLGAPTDLRMRELEAEMRPGFDTRMALWRKLVPISHLDVIRAFKRCAFISIQYNVEPAEVEFIERRLGLPIHFLADDFSGPVDDAAALISALDAVVSIPNSHAHLSAALGRPTFVLLHDVPAATWAAQKHERLYPDVELCSKPWRREEDGRYLFGYNGDWRPTLKDALDRVCRRHE